MLSYNDVAILRAIVVDNKHDGGGLSLINGRTASYVQEKTKLSISKVRRTLNRYVADGLLIYGVRTKDKQYTFVITEKGLDLLDGLTRNTIAVDEDDNN